jgi:hypothetical protein
VSGLTPVRTSDKEIVFFRGWCADSTGRFRISLGSPVAVNLDHIGPNGVDTAASRASGELYPYVIGNSSSGEAAIVLSNQITYGKVARPAEYDVIRKLPWGFVLINDKIPPFHFSGWGHPFTRLTDAGTTPRWQALAKGQSREGFTAVSLSRWVPDNARMAYILVKAENAGGSRAGSAFLRVSARQGDGIQLGELSGEQIAYFPLHQRINSKRELFFRTTGDVTLDIWVLGYTNTEPS